MTTTVSTELAATNQPTLIIKVGDVFIVTLALLVYDPNDPHATEENRTFIREKIAPYYEDMALPFTPRNWDKHAGKKRPDASMAAETPQAEAAGLEVGVKVVPGLPHGFTDQATKPKISN